MDLFGFVSDFERECRRHRKKNFLCCFVVLENEAEEKKKEKKMWMKKWYQDRNHYTHENLLGELRQSSSDDYKNFLRMDAETFDELLSLVQPIVQKENTNMREAVCPSMRLSATLRFLATGNKFEDLNSLTAISPRSLGGIVIETCEAIITSLRYIQVIYSFICLFLKIKNNLFCERRKKIVKILGIIVRRLLAGCCVECWWCVKWWWCMKWWWTADVLVW